MKLSKILGQSFFFFSHESRAIGVILRPFDHPDGKDHAGRFVSFSLIHEFGKNIHLMN